MRFNFVYARVAALLTALCAVTGLQAQTLAPNPVPTKVVHNQWMIKATVGGQEGWYLLTTASKTSIRLPRAGESGADGRLQSADVSIGGVSGPTVKFRVAGSPPLKALGVDGALGADALAGFTLAFDVEEAQVATWTDQPSLLGQRGWILLLPVLGSATQHAITLSIDDVDKMPYGVKGSIGDNKGLGVVQLSEIDAKAAAPALSGADVLTVTPPDTVAIDNVMLADMGPFWLMANRTATPLPYASGKEIASIPLTSLPVRRLILDGHTGTMVTELLGESGVNSLLLSRMMGIPVEIDEGTIYLRKAGALYGGDLNPYAGGLVTAIAGISADNILFAMQGPAAGKLDMLKRLARARTGGYALDFVKDDKPYHTTVRPPL
ncbi:MAG TPA: hypothetical protein VKT78_18010 [Fimbriimonadaceae bacterium]|nr:hypothetical protein [Fimbriimonadaceae bacterium]